MSNTTNYTQVSTAAQSPVWMVATSWEVEPEFTEKKRSSDGKFLKRNISLNTKTKSSAFNDMLANEMYEGCG